MRRRIAGIEFDRAAELPLGFAKIPVVVEERVAERGVGFRRPIVHFEGLARESPGLEERFVRREDARLPAAEHVVAVSETRVREGKGRICFDRSLEAFERVEKAVLRAAVPEIAAFQVEL